MYLESDLSLIKWLKWHDNGKHGGKKIVKIELAKSYIETYFPVWIAFFYKLL